MVKGDMAKEDIVLWRQLHWLIYTAEEALGLRPGGHLEMVRDALPLIDRLDEVLITALAARAKLDPFRYRAVWTIRNLVVKYGATTI
jgi:hypothetical protein